MKKKVDDYDVLGTLSFDEAVVPLPESNNVNAQSNQGGKPSKKSNKSVQGKIGKRKKKEVQRNTGVLVPKTYKLPSDLVDQVGRVAYWQRRKVQDIIAEALRTYLKGVPEEDLAEKPKS